MSAFGTKRTSQLHVPMSAFGSKADIVSSGRHGLLLTQMYGPAVRSKKIR